MTRREAHTTLRELALSVREADEEAAVSRLLERVAARDDAAELRDALVELGVRAALRTDEPVGAVRP